MVSEFDNPAEDDLMEMRQFWRNPACGNSTYDNGAEGCLND
jgi:hypothetical protein